MPWVRCAAQFVPLADIFFTDISKLFRLVYQKGAKNATWHFNKLGPWANWMSGSLQSLIQHQKQLLWEFPLSNFYQFRPFTPKWNLRLLPSSLNFLNISGSFKCYRGGRKAFSRGKNREWRKKLRKNNNIFTLSLLYDHVLPGAHIQLREDASQIVLRYNNNSALTSNAQTWINCDDRFLGLWKLQNVFIHVSNHVSAS